MTLEAISNDMLMREKAKIHNPEIVQKRRSLPVFNHRDEILKIIEENSVVLIKGTTGCGKSTQVRLCYMPSHTYCVLGLSIPAG
jgi:HrpA-like RNA helicase